MDKAGAYGIQGLGAALVESVRGDFYTVVGLPVSGLVRLFDALGRPYAFTGLDTPVEPVTDAAPPPTVAWLPDRPGIALLDQTRLPTAEVIVPLEFVDQVAEAIQGLRVRGAPAIGVTAAMGLAVSLTNWLEHHEDATAAEALGQVRAFADQLAATRPTARNLQHMLDRMCAHLDSAAEAPFGSGDTSDPSHDSCPVPWAGHPLARAAVVCAESIRSEDIAMCRAIGEAGWPLFPPEGVRILTHCNTGTLATAGAGTALSILYRLHEEGVPLQVLACEARPVLQGARLTAWELQRRGVDVTLITDSMAGAAMSAGQADAVVLGADAICANGDVVNKIGTYALGVLAREHGLPFYVAAPRSTVAMDVARAEDIPIEVREPDEIRVIRGNPIAPTDVPVWNPAFDRTPHHLVTALITDRGVIRPPFGPGLKAQMDET